ncbi:hypothetical protein ADUPG1_009653 [Aduncisulcus paluster]|uniref:Uncharacterized protein n=1 Tax=Aduncisulcus paluster TaxID=2918883 RepID=A0ABQ5KWD1_9EUKA|nr:hypothetical protein ADUPG1_009653 [Aduncisulcus paluster]
MADDFDEEDMLFRTPLAITLVKTCNELSKRGMVDDSFADGVKDIFSNAMKRCFERDVSDEVVIDASCKTYRILAHKSYDIMMDIFSIKGSQCRVAFPDPVECRVDAICPTE